MSRLRTIAISDEYDRFVERKTASGDYDSAESVIEDGLRLLREQDAEMEALCVIQDDGTLGPPLRLDELQAEIRKGWESGDPVEVDFKTLFAEALSEVEGRK